MPFSWFSQKLALLSNPQLFEKLDPEALFFSFYYQPGSFQQYLAARELKRQCWRYHKQHSAWFQVRAGPGFEGFRGVSGSMTPCISIHWRSCMCVRPHLSGSLPQGC